MARRLVTVIEDGKRVHYERLGSCSQCGECCEKFAYKVRWSPARKDDAPLPDEIDWSKWEGWAAEDWDGKIIWWSPMEIGPREKLCDCFDLEAKSCSKFGTEEWPDVCRKFPVKPSDLDGLTDCGFTFRRING